MKRWSSFFLVLTLLMVGVFFAYKYYMIGEVRKAFEDSKSLSNQSLVLKHEKVYQHGKGEAHLFSPGGETTDIHSQMALVTELYEVEKPLSENDFSIVVPEALETELKGVKKLQVHYRRYRKGLISVDLIDDRMLRSYHIKEDDTQFNTSQLLQHYGSRLDEEILKTLSVQAIPDGDAILASLSDDHIVADFKKNFFFSDRTTYLEDSILLESPLLQTPIKVPYASLFDVIDSQYLKGNALQAYEVYVAEEKARKEAEEAARIEEERQRQLSAFDYGPTLTGERVVALTFDDGPNPATTPQVLDILDRYGAKATFYILGSAIGGNESILKRMVNSGHELGNHTWSHPSLTGLSAEQIIWQFNATTEAIQSAAGVTPKTFRPPYGATNAFVKSQTTMTQMLWTVDTLDWKNRSTEGIMANIRATVHPGAVILMHDIHPTTMNALPTVMDYLVSEGYRFVTVSELYGLQ